MSDGRAIEECVGEINAGIRESIAILGAEILDINRANGWNVTTPEQFGAFEAGEEYGLPAFLATIHASVSDVLESYRNRDVLAYRVAVGTVFSLAVQLSASADAAIDNDDPPFVAPFRVEDPPNTKIPAVMALIHSEVSEALEGFEASDPDNFAEEMADVVIRCLDCTAGLGIDLGSAILAKLEKNRGRGFRHGGKVV